MKESQKDEGFTLLEMLIVLFVIAVLLILFVPNLMKQTESIDNRGNEALTKVVETQSEMYFLDHQERPTDLKQLKEKGYLTKEQVEKAEKIGIKVE